LSPISQSIPLPTSEASGFTAETARSQYKLTRKSTKMKVAGGFLFYFFLFNLQFLSNNCFSSPQQEIFQRERKKVQIKRILMKMCEKKGEKKYKFVPKDVSMCFVCVLGEALLKGRRIHRGVGGFKRRNF
jgi:hypothetical protein